MLSRNVGNHLQIYAAWHFGDNLSAQFLSVTQSKQNAYLLPKDPLCCPETSAIIYRSMPRDISEAQRLSFHAYALEVMTGSG